MLLSVILFFLQNSVQFSLSIMIARGTKTYSKMILMTHIPSQHCSTHERSQTQQLRKGFNIFIQIQSNFAGFFGFLCLPNSSHYPQIFARKTRRLDTSSLSSNGVHGSDGPEASKGTGGNRPRGRLNHQATHSKCDSLEIEHQG